MALNVTQIMKRFSRNVYNCTMHIVLLFCTDHLKQVMMERVQTSSSEFTVKGKLCGYRILQVLSWHISITHMWHISHMTCNQCCQPPIFSPDICTKSESNPKCLRKSLHQTDPKRRVIASKPVLRQKHVFSTKPFS